MALPAFVQATTGVATGFNGSVTSTNFASSVTGGNAILVALVNQGTTTNTTTVADSQGNTYNRISFDTASSFYTAVHIAYNVTGGANFNVTISDSFANDADFVAMEISGVVATESVSNVSGTGSSQATPSISTTGATVNANDILIGVFSCEEASTNYTVGAGYSNLTKASGHAFSYDIATETRVVSATGTYSASMGGQGTLLGAAAFIIALSNTAIGPTTSTSSSTSQSTSTSSTSSSTSTSLSSTSSSISTSSTSSSTSISTSSTSSSTSTSISTSSTSSSTSVSTSTSSTSSSTSTSNSTSLSSTSISSTSTSTTVSLTTSTSSTSSSTSRSTSTSQSTSSTSNSTSTSISTSSTSSSTSTSKSTSTSSTSTSQSSSTSLSTSSTSTSTSVSFTTSTSISSTSTSTTTIIYSQFKPVIDIKPQILTQANIIPSTTLVDDTVALVDDPSSYVGSLVTPIADFRIMVSIKPKR